MKLKELALFILKNKSIILKNKKSKKSFWFLFVYWINLLDWHKKKRRPGKISFEHKYFFFDDILLKIDVEFKFIRQNTYDEDQNKLSAIIKRQGWQNNLKNNLALIPVFFIIFWEIYTNLYEFYQIYFYFLAFRSPIDDALVKVGFKSLSSFNCGETFIFIYQLNSYLVDILINFAINFNMIF